MSGKNRVKMDALRKMYGNMEFTDIVTYIQSGNVIFKSESAEPEELGSKIARQIEKDFGFSVPAIVLTIDDLQQIVDNNPFAKDPGKDKTFLHVTFLSSDPDIYDLKAIEGRKQGGEEIFITGHSVYLYCPDGYGRTKLDNSFLEAKLKVGATTRNWKTTNELLNIGRQLMGCQHTN